MQKNQVQSFSGKPNLFKVSRRKATQLFYLCEAFLLYKTSSKIVYGGEPKKITKFDGNFLYAKIKIMN